VNDSSITVMQVAAAFVWLGMVIAISLLEAPLKFRAPGITLALGLGIGELVFRVLNRVEFALAATVLAALFLSPRGLAAAVLVAGLWAILLVQVIGLRPRLNARTRRIIAGAALPPSRTHLVYIVLEGVKVLALAALGALLVLEGHR
jgi:hypothetical protein